MSIASSHIDLIIHKHHQAHQRIDNTDI